MALRSRPSGRRGRPRRRALRQDHRRPRRLGEVEVREQIAELWEGFAHCWTRIGAAVRLRV